MGVVVLGIQKDRPGVVLLIDPIGDSSTSIALGESVDPERVFVGEKNGEGSLTGTMYQFSDLDRLERIANRLFGLLEKFGHVPCPMCGAKLKLEDETFVCNKVISLAHEEQRCPFRAPMDFFLKKEKGEDTP